MALGHLRRALCLAMGGSACYDHVHTPHPLRLYTAHVPNKSPMLVAEEELTTAANGLLPAASNEALPSDTSGAGAALSWMPAKMPPPLAPLEAALDAAFSAALRMPAGFTRGAPGVRRRAVNLTLCFRRPESARAKLLSAASSSSSSPAGPASRRGL